VWRIGLGQDVFPRLGIQIIRGGVDFGFDTMCRDRDV